MAIVELNARDHGNLKLKPGFDGSIIEDQHMLPLVIPEFVSASIEFPIVFVKMGDTDDFQPVAMLGLKPEENLFYTDGGWTGLYTPAVVSVWPFRLVPSEINVGEPALAIADESALLGEEEGHPLFDEAGQESEFLAQMRSNLQRFMDDNQATIAFTKWLKERDLLRSQDINIQMGEEKATMGGIYVVDEAKLAEMSAEDFVELRDKGVLSAIYAHLVSINQVHRLIRHKQLAAKQSAG